MEREHGAATGWPVAWSAVWVGALAAIAVGLVIGLIGFAVGAHEATRAARWRDVRLITLAFGIGGAFFSFVVGGWAAGRILGVRRAEPAILHAVIAWLVSVPILIVLTALGGTTHFGAWYGGLAGPPAWAPAAPSATADAAAILRNDAAAAAVALLLGLIGSVLGGWMASGEPMTLGYYRRRDRDRYEERPRRAA